MVEKRTYQRQLWTVAALAGLSITAGIGFCQIEPSDRNAALIQFDVISELNCPCALRVFV